MFKLIPLMFVLLLTGCSTMVKTNSAAQLVMLNQNPAMAPINAVTGQYVALVRHIFFTSESSPFNHFN